MDLDKLREIVRAYDRATKMVTAAEARVAEAKKHKLAVRTQLAEAIADYSNGGTPQQKIVEITSYTRERVRQITNEVNKARSRASEAGDGSPAGVPSSS